MREGGGSGVVCGEWRWWGGLPAWSHTLTHSIANWSGLLDTDCFTLEYTVNRSDSKDIAIRNTADYKTLIEEILTLNRPASLFKVQITEQKVSSPVLQRICRPKSMSGHLGARRG